MGLIDKLFGEKSVRGEEVAQKRAIEITQEGNSIIIGELGKITFVSDEEISTERLEH